MGPRSPTVTEHETKMKMSLTKQMMFDKCISHDAFGIESFALACDRGKHGTLLQDLALLDSDGVVVRCHQRFRKSHS